MPTDVDLRRLSHELGHFQPPLSPVREPSKWLSANVNSIQYTWEEAFKCPKEDLAGLKRLIYPRLYTYTLGHLKFHTDSQLLSDFHSELLRWIQFDELVLLRDHKSLKDTLWAFKNRSRNNQTPETSGVKEDVSNLLQLDVLSIATRVLAIVNEDSRKRSLLDLKSSDAQTVLDLLQNIVDIPDLDVVRPLILRILLELSTRSELYPSSLVLHDVQPQGKEPVAAGSYGDIWKGTLAGHAVAIKVTRIDPMHIHGGIKAFCKEAIVWRQLHHPNVLPFEGAYHWSGTMSHRVCLVSPWMENGNIIQHLERNPDADRRSFVLDVASGLSYLHTFDPPVIHGDLRGKNILVTLDQRACIADFGLCTLARDSFLRLTPSSSAYRCTNLLWLAPEFFKYEDKETSQQSPASDIYAYGCLCYEIFSGRPRFSEFRALYEVAVAVAQDRRPARPVHGALDDALWELMDKCWSKTPSIRPTACEIVHYLLAHPTIPDTNPEATTEKPAFPFPLAAPQKSLMYQDIIIALVGPTGSGKSRFINVATHLSSVIVGDDLASCTQEVQAVSYPHPDGSGRNIVFVDTPGFDDTERTDFQVLERIANWMKETYKAHEKLTGLLYFHRITDAKMRGTALKNLTMFEALCGKDALQNVILTTTMWDHIDPFIGLSREQQLHRDFWAPLLGEGCRTARFGNTVRSAWDIINSLEINTPRPVLLQTEMVDEQKDLKATSAFIVLVRWWEDVLLKFKSKFRRRK